MKGAKKFKKKKALKAVMMISNKIPSSTKETHPSQDCPY
jgi:hypothetical protein